MTEYLITYKTAKLACQKGFDEHTRFIYWFGENLHEIGGYNTIEREEDNLHYSAPTQSFLQRWLRDVHNIHIEIVFSPSSNKHRCRVITTEVVYRPDFVSTYEEALEDALVNALNLIPSQK